MSKSIQDEDDAIIEAARADFLIEAQQLIVQLETSLLALEKSPNDEELINSAFRAAHTIKGTAGLFGVDAVVAFTHDVESLLDEVRSGNSLIDAGLIALLLESRDQIELLLAQAGSDPYSPEIESNGLLLSRRLRAAMPGIANDLVPVDEPASTAECEKNEWFCWRVKALFTANAMRSGLDPLSFLRYLGTVGEIRRKRLLADGVPSMASLDPEQCYIGFEVDIEGPADYKTIEDVFEFAAQDCDLLISELPLASSPSGSGNVSDSSAPPRDSSNNAEHSGDPSDRRKNGGDRRMDDKNTFIRVRADRLDALIDLIGELVIASSGAQIAADDNKAGSFAEAAQRISSLVETARDRALSLRMVPISETFSRFNRVVRDASLALGKSVKLQITGADTVLDKTMVELIADPLMHLVRNSLDHGIESRESRLQQGKPEVGCLALNAYHESGAIIIEVSDDGIGLNRTAILDKAVQRGLLSADQNLSDHEVHQLICLPGFSTAAEVTDISGRGVGMDVVKRSIEALRGQLLIASTPGQGTTTQIRIPLTLSMIDGFLCSVNAVNYVIPLEMVSECIETPNECNSDSVSGYFDLRGDVMPYLDVRKFLGCERITYGRQSMIVVNTSGSKVGLLVDRLHGEHQTVIKPLGPIFEHLKGIAGSTILGSGDVALILDVAGLIEQLKHDIVGHDSASTKHLPS